MQWHSVGEFLAMGGYAGYVWGSVGACALAMTIEPSLLRRRHRELIESLQRSRRAAPAPRDASAASAMRRPLA